MKTSEVKRGDLLALQRSKYDRLTPVRIVSTHWYSTYNVETEVEYEGVTGTVRATPDKAKARLSATAEVLVLNEEAKGFLLVSARYLVGDYATMIEAQRRRQEADAEVRRARAERQQGLLAEIEALVGTAVGLLDEWSIDSLRRGQASRVAENAADLIVKSIRRYQSEIEETP